MIERLIADPAPYGGAVVLNLQASADTHVLVLATRTAAVPSPLAPGSARRVFEGILEQHTYEWRGLTASETPWWRVVDLSTKHLSDGQPVFYHVYPKTVDGYGAALSTTATPACLRDTHLTVAKESVKARLEYHLARALESGTLVVQGGEGDIRVEERETHVEHTELPIVLLKERAVPAPSGETIGHRRGDVVDTLNGTAYREQGKRLRSTVELLVVADNAEHRNDVGRFVHEVLEQDAPYYADAGLSDIRVSRFDRSEPADNFIAYLAELTFECEGEIIIREQLKVRVTDNLALGRWAD